MRHHGPGWGPPPPQHLRGAAHGCAGQPPAVRAWDDGVRAVPWLGTCSVLASGLTRRHLSVSRRASQAMLGWAALVSVDAGMHCAHPAAWHMPPHAPQHSTHTAPAPGAGQAGAQAPPPKHPKGPRRSVHRPRTQQAHSRHTCARSAAVPPPAPSDPAPCSVSRTALRAGTRQHAGCTCSGTQGGMGGQESEQRSARVWC